MKNKIVVIGSTNVDMVMQLSTLPKPGETIGNGQFELFHGGKGANQAVAAARAGGAVHFVSCLGKDHFASDLRSNFEADGIQTDYIFVLEEVSTGTALIMVDEQAENCIGVAPGANGKLSPQHIEQAKAVIENADYVLLQFEIPMESVHYAIYLAHKLGSKVIVNPAPAAELSDEILRKIEILVLNESEAAFLIGGKQENQKAAEIAQYFLDKGVQQVVLTLGAKGAYIANTKERTHIPTFKVNAVDTTGAGDTFCGALAARLQVADSLETAAIFASAAAAIAVTGAGAQSSIPHRTKIENFLANQGESDKKQQ
ncbi:MAG: ribokinase [Bacteroidota bacterium]